MSVNMDDKREFSEQVKNCIALAKSIAAKDGKNTRLDSLHLAIAMIKKASNAAQEVFEKTGYCWSNVQKVCPEVRTGDADIKTKNSMKLVGRLEKIVRQLFTAKRQNKEPQINVDEFLNLLLQNPSVRLKGFLRRIENGTNIRDNSSLQNQTVQPFRSFREYLTARKQLWLLRLKACSTIEKYHKPKQEEVTNIVSSHKERSLTKLAHLQHEIENRIKGSASAATVSLQITEGYGFSTIQAELIEGLFIHELYSVLAPFNTPVTVRALAQMTAPESYPRNCRRIIDAVDGLIKAGGAKLSEWDDGICTMSSRISLQPGILDELWDHLENDVIDESDLRSARRKLYESNECPL